MNGLGERTDYDALARQGRTTAARAERLFGWAAVVGLAVVVAISGLTGRWSAEALAGQTGTARLVEVTGRQSTLIQQADTDVSSASDPSLSADDAGALRFDLQRVAWELDRIDVGVQHGDTGLGLIDPPPAVLLHRYARDGWDLSHRLEVFAAAARTAADAPWPLPHADIRSLAVHSQAHGPLANDVAALVAAVADDGQRRTKELHGNIMAGVTAVWLVAGAEVVAVFWPLSRRMRRRRQEADQVMQDMWRATSMTDALMTGLDVGVVGLFPHSDRLWVNTAARCLLGHPPDGPVTRADLAAALSRAVVFEGLPAGLGLRGPVPPDAAPPGTPAWVEPFLRGAENAEVQIGLAGRPVRLDPYLSGAADDGPVPLVTDVPARLVLRSRALMGPNWSPVGVVLLVQDVTELHERHQALGRQAAQLAAIGEAARALLREDDARATVCRVAGDVADALLASLYEPDGHGDLVCTASSAPHVVGMRMPLSKRSKLAEAFHQSRTVTAGELSTNVGVDLDTVHRLSQLVGRTLRSGAWLPVTSRGQCRGVLSLAFDTDETHVVGQLAVLEVLAAETAVALERQDLLLQLAAEASQDGLTGAGNRRHWEEQLPLALDAARWSDRAIAIMILDLDHFKAYNDAYGHPAGDALLRDCVTAWSRRLRPGDLLCRYGGEEFAVILHHCSLQDGLRVAEALRVAVPAGQTCSVGVAAWDGRERGADLVARADRALYAAKAEGRDRVALAQAG